MTERVKNFLGVAIIVALIAFAFAVVSYVNSYSKSFEPSSFRSFNVTGQGKAVAVPDVAAFTFSVISKGEKNIADLQKENSDKVNAAIKFVKEQGVEDKDIKTETYNLSPEYQYYNCNPRILPDGSVPVPCPPPVIAGYTITQTVEVKIRDFKKISAILGGVVTSGANSVSQLNFKVDDETHLENEAREKAIKQAREKAEATARAGGFRVGRLLSIDEGYYPQPLYGLGAGRGGDTIYEKGGVAAPVIEPGSQEIMVNVNLRYEIE